MAQMPADAPRSEDGQWWWDGSAWQPVASGQAAAGSAQYLATGEIAAGTDVGLPDIEMGVSHIAEVLVDAAAPPNNERPDCIRFVLNEVLNPYDRLPPWIALSVGGSLPRQNFFGTFDGIPDIDNRKLRGLCSFIVRRFIFRGSISCRFLVWEKPPGPLQQCGR